MMQKLLCLALLLPILAIGAGKLSPYMVENVPFTGDDGAIPSKEGMPPLLTVSRNLQPGNPRPLDIVGRIDTVGGTQYDWWLNGPAMHLIDYDPDYGIHVTWMYSLGQPGTDRNMRYNFYDLSLTPPQWVYSQGPDFMLWGLNGFDIRTGYGNLDFNQTSHCEYLSAHRATSGATFQPTVAQDQIPGAGSFLYCPGEPNVPDQLWPVIGLTQDQTIHTASIKDEGATRDKLFYEKISEWCTWLEPFKVNDPAPDAGFPNHNLAASKLSNKVAVIWAAMVGNPATEPMRGFYRISQDAGANWDDPIELPFPNGFNSGDSQPTFDIQSFYGIFDSRDSLHLVANLQPFISPYVNWVPSQIWHYSTETGWSMIHAAYTDTFNDPGQNSAFAGRPSLAEGANNEFVCIWEQFDSVETEPNTGIARCRILGARSTDGGMTWGPVLTLAGGGTTSRRYPSLCPRIVRDTCHIIYLEDLEAGCAAGPTPVGTMTNNPVIHHSFWAGALALAEDVRSGARLSLRSAATPNPFLRSTAISYELPEAGNVTLRIYDEAGRPVRTLVNMCAKAGRYAATWNGQDDDGTQAAAGIYFYTLFVGDTKQTRKLTLLQ